MSPVVLTSAPAPPRRLLVSIMQACEIAGVSRRSIYNWLAKGKLEYVRTAGGSVRIYVDTLLKAERWKGVPSA